MAKKPDTTRLVAETLVATLTVGGGAAVVSAAGAPVVLVGMGGAIVNGLFKILFAAMLGKPDPHQILTRIRSDRTAHTVETLRDAFVEAMELKPEFKEPIEELADAAEAGADGRDEERFRAAIGKLCDVVMQASANLGEIKADTAHIPDIHRIVLESHERIKRIENGVTGASTPRFSSLF